MEGKIQIFVLKRSNGFIGIYVNGHKQENLASNFPQSMKAEHLFDIMLEVSNQSQPCEIIFTEDEGKFKSGLPNLQEYLGTK